MKLQRALATIGELAAYQVVARRILDEGRIFALGLFEKENQVHGGVRDVGQGLKEHLGQALQRHSWAVVLEMSTFKQTGHTSPMSLYGPAQRR